MPDERSVYLEDIPVETAWKALIDALAETERDRALPGERVPVRQALGRVTAEPVVARISSPHYHAAAMDGYAVRDADIGTLPARLRVAGESFPGSGYTGSLEPGCCVRIFTGAPVPAGADRVIV